MAMMTYSLKNPLFPLGRILIAPEIESLGIDIARLLRNHQTGDFGCVDQYDVEQNHHAIECGDGILSQYHVEVGEQRILICVMTEADRFSTVAFVMDKRKLESPEAPENGDNEDPETS
jgi:hypothetical protein